MRHEVENRHRHPADQQRRDLPGHECDGQSLEDGVRQDDRRAHDDGHCREQHGAKADSTRVHHGLGQRHAFAQALLPFAGREREALELAGAPLRGFAQQSRRRFDGQFIAIRDEQRRAILDDIAWPARAKPELSHGVAFFSRFRDLTAAGFFSSAMGRRDVQYSGNVFVQKWDGCPPPALEKLGVGYDLMRSRVDAPR